MTITTKFGLKKAIENKEEEIIIEGPYTIRILDRINMCKNYIRKTTTGAVLISPLSSFLFFGTNSSKKIIMSLINNYELTFKDLNRNKIIFKMLK